MKKITAIVADDVPELRQLLRCVLREFGCDVVHEVRDGVQVLAAVEKEKPDILFLDLDMPDMTGLEVLTQLNVLPHPPYTVIVTADTRLESRRTAIDSGAQAYITKPYASQNVGAVINAYCAQRDAALACTALIADDDELMRDLLTQALEKQHCRVISAVANGAEALAYLTQYPAPDMVFLDIDMPVLDGLSTLQKIREHKLEVFCAMVSAHSTFQNVKRALDQGADGFIVKPYTEEKVRQMLAKRLATKKTPSTPC